MKQIINILAAVLFCFLFYNQSIGLNLSLFSLTAILFLLFWNPNQIKTKKGIVYTVVYAITAVFVFYTNTALSILANFVAFFTLVGAISNMETSIYVNWVNGLYTSIAAVFHRSVASNTTTEIKKVKKDIDVLHIVKLTAIPLVLVIIFVLLYRNGNPIFNDLVSAINFDFINFQWLLFTAMGYYLFNNISQPVKAEPATSLDLNTSNNLSKIFPFNIEALKKESQLGLVLLGLLNLVLVLYITTDFISLSRIDYSRASELSNQVHSGINTLIASIIIAIIIILYFFRGNLNFYENNKLLKSLTYLWIGLNIILVGLIAFKNQNYIIYFGLTYKRIGVHIYILLTLIGLITTALKVSKVRNLVFLFRINTIIAFTLLILMSSIQWDKSITIYNLTTAQNFDIAYLLNLSDNNAVTLYELKSERNLSQESESKIDAKYERYLQKIENQNWQELSFEAINLKTD